MTEKEFKDKHGLTDSEFEAIKPTLRLFNCGPDCIVRFHAQTGAELAVAGADRAARNANASLPNWTEVATDAVREFVGRIGPGRRFQAEDVRRYAGKVPPAPSLRAWGAVMVRAAKEGLIRQVGYEKVNNPLAHSTPAAVWEAT